ncbi:acyltransferase family protein [Solemya pervernicosa gill symbiont]|nr:acyltransferase family protein [Solemya pervernicosa gill symbiont]
MEFEVISTKKLFGGLGLIGIFVSVVFLDDTTLFPGFAALIPVFATALVIISTSSSNGLIYKLLTLKPMIYIGKISYSLYLFHWPLIVFPTLYLGRNLELPEMLLVLLTAIILSTLSWRYIEQPLRQKQSQITWSKVKIYLSIAGISIFSVAIYGIQTNGIPSRIKPEALSVNALLGQVKKDDLTCLKKPNTEHLRKANICSYYDMPEPVDYLLWGDSHARMYYKLLSKNSHDINLSSTYYGMADCQPLFGVFTSKAKNRKQCSELVDYLSTQLQQGAAKTIILAARWASLASSVPSPGDNSLLSKDLFDYLNDGKPITFKAALHRTVAQIRETGAKVLIIGPTPEIEFDVPNMLTRTYHLDLKMPLVSRSQFDQRQSQVIAAMKEFESKSGVSVVYPHELLCDQSQCDVADGLKALYTDDDHLSDFGVTRIMPILISELENLLGRT